MLKLFWHYIPKQYPAEGFHLPLPPRDGHLGAKKWFPKPGDHFLQVKNAFPHRDGPFWNEKWFPGSGGHFLNEKYLSRVGTALLILRLWAVLKIIIGVR